MRQKEAKNKYLSYIGGNTQILRAFFTNRLSAPVPLITPWLRAKMPAATVKQSTTGRCEFVKNALKIC